MYSYRVREEEAVLGVVVGVDTHLLVPKPAPLLGLRYVGQGAAGWKVDRGDLAGRKAVLDGGGRRADRQTPGKRRFFSGLR